MAGVAADGAVATRAILARWRYAHRAAIPIPATFCGWRGSRIVAAAHNDGAVSNQPLFQPGAPGRFRFITISTSGLGHLAVFITRDVPDNANAGMKSSFAAVLVWLLWTGVPFFFLFDSVALVTRMPDAPFPHPDTFTPTRLVPSCCYYTTTLPHPAMPWLVAFSAAIPRLWTPGQRLYIWFCRRDCCCAAIQFYGS